MASIPTVNALQAKKLLTQGSVLIDVREPGEYKNGYIEGAILLPLKTIQASALTQYNSQTILIYCHKGVRSLKACRMITEQNPQANVLSLDGGIEAWQSEGFDIQKPESKGINIHYQALILSAILFLTMLVLGLTVSYYFFLLALCFALLLLTLNLLGYQLFARLLCLAPWNR